MYLPVSFNQAIEAITPFFTANFAFLITCKEESVEVCCALLPVVFGIVLTSNSEHLFHLFGFLVCWFNCWTCFKICGSRDFVNIRS
ncbi:hypothetical protein NC651_002946 [Populus alba x Populus x berolinensis]|nr:hypothetical protein NC651_002946 [Populus alba x Populus x berolinensis]